MGRQAMSLPDALNRGQANARHLGHQPPGPVRQQDCCLALAGAVHGRRRRGLAAQATSEQPATGS